MAIKIKQAIIVVSAVILFLSNIACDNNVERIYYDTGELKSEIVKLDNHRQEIKEYYRNGQMASVGVKLNGLKEGFWKEWYVDGILKWDGEYLQGNRYYKALNLDDKDCILTIKDDPGILKVNETYNIRISVPDIHPEDLTVATNNGVIILCENRDEYDFVISPVKTGRLVLYIFAQGKAEKLLITEMSLDVAD